MVNQLLLFRIVPYVVVLLLCSSGCQAPHTFSKKKPAYLQTSTPSGTKIRGVYHTINRGETLWRIAKTYGIDLQYLAELNNIKDRTSITTDLKIFIPGTTRTKKIIIDTKQPPPHSKTTKIKGSFIWPVRGSLVSRFGIRNGMRYEGIEIAVPSGTPVKAASDGEVVYEGSLKGYGNLLILKHKNQYNTVYAYNHINLVRLGQKVKKGETIAKVGNSGRFSEPRLHFQIREKNQARNPLFFLP